MNSIIPVPALRSSDILVQQRLLGQIQSNQLDLLSLQAQLGTGRRVQRPSEDAAASVRGIKLQRLLEQKEQSRRNLESTRSFLTLSDSAISQGSGLIIDIRGLVVSMVDSTRTDTQREAAVTEINRTIEQLMADANRRFQDRSLFAGAQAGVTAFTFEGEFIAFHGNEGELPSYADIGFTFQSNVTAQEVFGALSEGVKSTADLNPNLTANTRLTELRGGRGMNATSIRVSDGVNDATIDLSGAETVGDVVDLLEANPPLGRQVTARTVGGSLQIAIDGGSLSIHEVGGGTTAAELGILSPTSVGVTEILGSDLNPILTKTTPLANTLGNRATAILRSNAGSGADDRNNDIVFEATSYGAALNGYAIQYVDDDALQAAPGLSVGAETARVESAAVAAQGALTFSGSNNNLILTANTPGSGFNGVQFNVVSGGALGTGALASYDSGTNTVNVQVDASGGSQIQNVIAAIDSGTPFTATYDSSDGADGGYSPTATVSAADIGAVTGSTGNSGGNPNTIFINIAPGATTASQVISAVNDPTSGVSGLFDVYLDPADEDGSAPAGSGRVNANATAGTAGGAGEQLDLSSGFLITNGGQTHTIDVQGAETVEDLLRIINASPAFVRAEINAEGTAIDVRSRLSGSELLIGENGGNTATQLGLRTLRAETALSELNYGQGVGTANGTDFTIRRSDGSEVPVDISTATTIGDVIELINNAAGEQIAQLASTGNGIQIVESNPTGGVALAILRDSSSTAAWDLGLVPLGAAEAFAGDGDPPQPATALLSFAAPDDANNAFRVTSTQPGTSHNGVQVIIDGSGASAAPTVAFDDVASTLTITIDPSQTTAQDIVDALNGDASQPFSAELDFATDPNNDGSGLIPISGPIGVTSGGTLNGSAQPARVVTTFATPYTVNSYLDISAANPGVAFNGVEVEFRDTLVGDTATAAYDPIGRRLTIDVDEGTTTANTVIAALSSVPEFSATLDTSVDPTNDGSGPVGGGLFTLSGGTAETLQSEDTNPHEPASVFNTLLKLRDAILQPDLPELERLSDSLDDDLDRLNFSRAEIGARIIALESLEFRVDNEDIELKDTLSKTIEVDFAKVLSELSVRQSTYEASLRLISNTLNLSLLQFI